MSKLSAIVEKLKQSGAFSLVALSGHQYASEYEEYLHRLLVMIRREFHYIIPFQQMDSVLIKHNINPGHAYADILSGRETDAIVLLTSALGLPQHTFGGMRITGPFVDADKQAIRWLPEGE